MAGVDKLAIVLNGYGAMGQRHFTTTTCLPQRIVNADIDAVSSEDWSSLAWLSALLAHLARVGGSARVAAVKGTVTFNKENHGDDVKCQSHTAGCAQSPA